MPTTGGDFEAAALRLSPEYTDDDVRNAVKGQPADIKAPLPTILGTDLSTTRTHDATPTSPRTT